MFRAVGDQLSLWESVLPAELLELPVELARVDAVLGDPALFAPFGPFFDPVIGRPSIRMEVYLRLGPGLLLVWGAATEKDDRTTLATG